MGAIFGIDYQVMYSQIFANATCFKNLYDYSHDVGTRGSRLVAGPWT
jgi:hypothetical protein